MFRRWMAAEGAEAIGLSPRVRGSPSFNPLPPYKPGSIPAGAGQPRKTSASSIPIRVYPRGCGAATPSMATISQSHGLSPRVRGSRHPRLTPRQKPGSIPAGAGQPHGPRRNTRPAEVYPRGCGAARLEDGEIRRVKGLSPRVRGSPLPRMYHRLGNRSIPAGAGQPSTHLESGHLKGVYPRGCGAARSTIQVHQRGNGLSPRVRGSHRGCPAAPTARGSIPAGAGQPQLRLGSCLIRRVYPRGCGAAITAGLRISGWEGLSPRVRGSLEEGLQSVGCNGSIPAGAGQPSHSCICSVVRPVYPRGCGAAVILGPR